MRTAQTIGNLIFGIMFMPWVWAEAIRLVAPKYHARMLAYIKREEETR
jgi:hypothetical protein